ncbi:MAG: sporulation-delaying protein SdpB family protein [Pseudonocardiaceae bacterium]
MLTRLGQHAIDAVRSGPWTNVYGLSRSLLALSSLGTLLVTPPSQLFHVVVGADRVPICSEAAAVSLYCLVPGGNLVLAQIIAICVLLTVLSGWRPRLTAIPHWWVTFSFQASATVFDGGDQIASIVILLITPIALTDSRRSHWSRSTRTITSLEGLTRSAVAWSAVFVVRLQVAGLYLQASVSKLGRPEWVDGTAVYYWLTDPRWGAPSWLLPVLQPILHTALGVALLTWSAIIIEFGLFLTLFFRGRTRIYWLIPGVLLHAGMAVSVGVVSFSLTMIGCLVLFLVPADRNLPIQLPTPPLTEKARS